MTNQRSITWTRRTFTAGQWLLIVGLCFYSLMTTTPLVSAHSEWAWSGWALGAMADAAFIMAITADSTLARHGVTHLGGWVRSFKWFTGLSVVYLNIWTAVEDRDAVGVAIHIIAPALVMLLAEVGPIYTAALAEAERSAGAPDTESVTDAQRDRVAASLGLPRPPATTTPDPEFGAWLTDAAEETDSDYAKQGAPAVDAEGGAALVDSVDAVAGALGMPTEPKAPRMSNAEANRIIAEGWRYDVPATTVAKETGRHVQTVRRKYKELSEQASA